MMRDKRGQVAITIALGILLISVITSVYIYSQKGIVQMEEPYTYCTDACSQGEYECSAVGDYTDGTAHCAKNPDTGCTELDVSGCSKCADECTSDIPCHEKDPIYERGTAKCVRDTSTGCKKWVLSDCSKCGDTIIQEGEDCEHNKDGDVFPLDSLGKPKTDCSQWKMPGKDYYQGVPAVCLDDCSLESCPYCGDGEVNSEVRGILIGEICDDAKPLTDYQKRCPTIFPYYEDPQGNPFLLAKCINCNFDNSDCPQCGDGTVQIEFGEGCEPGFAPQSCTDSKGYLGTQSCGSNCKWGNCVPTENCGDGKVNGNELCDGGSQKCFTAVDYYEGTQDCSPDCMSWGDCNPTEYCGDTKINGKNEKCDGPALPEGKEDCSAYSVKFYEGTNVLCSNCQIDTSKCEYCGDVTVNGNEECDGDKEGIKCSSACKKCIYQGCAVSSAFPIVQAYIDICNAYKGSESNCVNHPSPCAPIYSASEGSCYKEGAPTPQSQTATPQGSSTISTGSGGGGGGGSGHGSTSGTGVTAPPAETAITGPNENIPFQNVCGSPFIDPNKPKFVPTNCNK